MYNSIGTYACQDKLFILCPFASEEVPAKGYYQGKYQPSANVEMTSYNMGFFSFACEVEFGQDDLMFILPTIKVRKALKYGH